MARRVSWTNNSSGYDGTYVYRDTSPMDPQALPAPLGTAEPVPQGAEAEYIDNDALVDGDYYFRVRDFDGETEGDVSAEFSLTIASSFAITFVGVDSPTAGTGILSQNLTVPAGTVAGDLLAVSITHAGNISFSDGAWTTVGKSGNMNNSSYPIYHTFAYIVYDGSFSSVTISQTSAGTDHMSVSLASYHPEGGSLQISTLLSQGVTLSDTATAPVPDFTATASGLVLLSSGGKGSVNNATYDPPTGWNKRSIDGGDTRDVLADVSSAAGEDFIGLEYYPYGSQGDPAYIFLMQLVAS